MSVYFGGILLKDSVALCCIDSLWEAEIVNEIGDCVLLIIWVV